MIHAGQTASAVLFACDLYPQSLCMMRLCGFFVFHGSTDGFTRLFVPEQDQTAFTENTNLIFRLTRKEEYYEPYI